MSPSTFSSRWQEIRERIAAATARSGRPVDSVTLCAISKTFPAEAIADAYAIGQRDFGENRVQELLSKAPALPPDIRWHLIGTLQSNKVRKILGVASLVQTVDRLDLAQDLSRIARELGKTISLLLQVNVSRDPAKAGFAPEVIRSALPRLAVLPHLRITGLMTIPRLVETAEESRPDFAALRELRDELQTRHAYPLPHLSMGMSSDYEVAIEEGATIIRVGSALFGER
jgi:PLP dependent protein